MSECILYVCYKLGSSFLNRICRISRIFLNCTFTYVFNEHMMDDVQYYAFMWWVRRLFTNYQCRSRSVMFLSFLGTEIYTPSFFRIHLYMLTFRVEEPMKICVTNKIRNICLYLFCICYMYIYVFSVPLYVVYEKYRWLIES